MNTEKAIRARRTCKLKVNPDHPLPVTKGPEFRKTIEALIELAGQAPFHYESNARQRTSTLDGFEPWRFHALTGGDCRKLLEAFKQDEPQKCSDGIKEMLAAADALILGTWLPEPSRRFSRKFHPNVKNMEHIAATGAAIQNLLLAATSRGIVNYWSSGGCLRRPRVLQYLGIPKHEKLLGALFLFPEPDEDNPHLKIIPGKNLDKRGSRSAWMDWIEV